MRPAPLDRSGGLSDFEPAPNRRACHTPKIPNLPAKTDAEPLTQFFSSLFSCSLSRGSAQFFTPPLRTAPIVVRTAGDRTRRRRLNKLSCAGWVPHDRGSVSGLPALMFAFKG